MKHGNKIVTILFLVSFNLFVFADEKKFKLDEIQPSFDLEESTEKNSEKQNFIFNKPQTKNFSSNKSFSKLNFILLDKITAKKKIFSSKVKEVKLIETLEILSNSCKLIERQNIREFAAYIQIKDTNQLGQDKVFVYNGWIFSRTRGNYTVEHSLYDIWLDNCN